MIDSRPSGSGWSSTFSLPEAGHVYRSIMSKGGVNTLHHISSISPRARTGALSLMAIGLIKSVVFFSTHMRNFSLAIQNIDISLSCLGSGLHVGRSYSL